jgi:hypothetical protein
LKYQYSQNDSVEIFPFESLRSDWYASNSALPKAFLRFISGKRNYIFTGFPRQWIPIFEWFQIPWQKSIDPSFYIPIFSDFSEKKILDLIRRIENNKSMRIFVESVSMYDPIVSDFLYILDNSISITEEKYLVKDLNEFNNHKTKNLYLNGWQSYGRLSIRKFTSDILKITPQKANALILPCSLKRPYNASKTHKNIYKILSDNGFCVDTFHKIVITSLGIIPEEFWGNEIVISYNSGVPDIYRLLTLSRRYFKNFSYDLVIDCLQFRPYTDILQIIHLEGLIKNLERINVPHTEHFSIRP